MKLTNIAVIFMMSFLMIACSGGGEDSASSPSSAPVPIVPVVDEPVEPVVEEPIINDTVEPDPNAIYDTTAELIASKSFLFKQEYELAVSYKNNGNRSAYLSVCTEFTEEQNSIQVNYNSCLLRASIESDYTGTLSIANNQNNLVMAIWYLNDMENPRYETWENNSDNKDLKTFYVN